MTATHWAMIGIFVAAVGFDIYASQAKRLPTISEVVWKHLKKHPIIAFTAGVLCGHLFWQK